MVASERETSPAEIKTSQQRIDQMRDTMRAAPASVSQLHKGDSMKSAVISDGVD